MWSANSLNYQGQGNVIGLAYTPGNYHVLEDFQGSQPTGNAWRLRVLTSHEMGHNLSAGHDASGTCVSDGDCIMWPSVSINTSEWSTASVTSIQNNLNSRQLSGCASSCTNGVQDLGEDGIDCGGACDPCPCTSADTYTSPFSITITFDQYANESSWDIKNSSGTILHGNTYVNNNSNSTVTHNNLTIGDGIGYKFSFYDSYGDGICCGFGQGTFTLRDANNTVVLTHSNFGASAVKTFCIGSESKGEDECGNGDFTTTSSFTSGSNEVYGLNINSAHTINADVTFTAENSVNLFAGFEVGPSALFEAKIEPCVK